jgi:hypothetical protein
LHELTRDVLLNFPDVTLFAEFASANAAGRKDAESLLFQQFPRVTHCADYQSDEDLVSGSVEPNLLPLSGETSDLKSQEEALRLLASAIGFVNERPVTDVLKIVQWLKIVTRDDSLGPIGAWLCGRDEEQGPFFFIECLRLLAGSVRESERTALLLDNHSAICARLVADRSDSVFRFLFIFAAFPSQPAQLAILESAQFTGLLRFVIDQPHSAWFVGHALDFIQVPEVFLRALLPFPRFVLEIPALLPFFEGFATLSKQRLVEHFLISPNDAAAEFIAHQSETFAYSEFVHVHLPEIASVFLGCSSLSALAFLECAAARHNFAIDLTTAVVKNLQNHQAPDVNQCDRALMLCAKLPSNDAGGFAAEIDELQAEVT